MKNIYSFENKLDEYHRYIPYINEGNIDVDVKP